MDIFILYLLDLVKMLGEKFGRTKNSGG